MKEIEILVRLLTPPDEVLHTLKEWFVFEGTHETVDIYFVDPLRPDLAPDKEGRLSGCLRLRTKDKQRSFLTYKHDHFDAEDKWTFSDEFESQITSPENIQEILKRLGFQELVTVKLKKHIFHNDWAEIVVEEVEELGAFLEVEAKNLPEDADVNAIREKINRYIDQLGFQVIRDFDGGKPELLLRKKMGLDK